MPRAAWRRIVLGIVLGLVVRGLAGGGGVAVAEAAGPCEALVGKWKWFTGGVVSINPNRTIVYDGGNDGTWECTDPARGRVTLRWRVGGYVNSLALSGDGRTLSSTDLSQWYVTAQRIGTPRTVGPPAPAKPAEPSRRAETPPPAKASQTAKATDPKAADPKPPDPKATGPVTPVPRAPESRTVTPPAAARKAETPSTGPVLPPGAKSGQPGPCSGNACMRIKVETADRCVWLRSSADDVVQAEVRLATETVTVTLEKPDMAKVAKDTARTPPNSPTARQAETKRRFDELRRQGHSIPYDPKLEGPLTPAPAKGPALDRSRGWHGTMYDPLSGTDRPVLHARIDGAGGCVKDPGEILSYRVTWASATAKEAPERAIPCTGDACGDVDASSEQVRACRFANRGGRAIAVGIVRSSNQHVSVKATLDPNGTMRLDFFAGCLRSGDIGRIEARYK